MKTRSFFYFLMLVPALFSCSSGFKTTPLGTSYRIFPSGNAQHGMRDDIIFFRLKITTDKDSDMLNNFKTRDSLSEVILMPRFQGDMNEIFPMLARGDSAVMKVKADSFYHNHCPANIRGHNLAITLKVLNIINKDRYKQQLQQKHDAEARQNKEMNDKDEAELAGYVKAHDPEALKTESGMYYHILKPGSGRNFKDGDVIWAHYAVKLLDGKLVDTDSGKTEPLKFYYSSNNLMKGFKEALQYMKNGSDIILYIPSSLAYGKRSAPNIPAYSSLVFRIQIIAIK